MKIALPTRLAEQSDIRDDNVVAHGLAHVIDGERRHGGGRQSLHLHPRPACGATARCDNNRGVRLVQLKRDRGVVQRKQIGRAHV